MRYFELNGRGKNWVYKGETLEDAELEYIKEVCGKESVDEYEEYCREVNVDGLLKWTEWCYIGTHNGEYGDPEQVPFYNESDAEDWVNGCRESVWDMFREDLAYDHVEEFLSNLEKHVYVKENK